MDNELTLGWATTDDAAVGADEDAIERDRELRPWQASTVTDPDGREWTVRGRVLPWVPGWWFIGRSTSVPGLGRRRLMHDLFDELPLVAVALAVFPIALLMVEMGIVAILAPAVWLLRRWSGRQALMVVTAPSGVVVQTPLTAEGRTVARRREAVAALIRRGAVTDPFDELPEQQTSLDLAGKLPAPDLARSHYETRYVVVNTETGPADGAESAPSTGSEIVFSSPGSLSLIA